MRTNKSDWWRMNLAVRFFTILRLIAGLTLVILEKHQQSTKRKAKGKNPLLPAGLFLRSNPPSFGMKEGRRGRVLTENLCKNGVYHASASRVDTNVLFSRSKFTATVKVLGDRGTQYNKFTLYEVKTTVI
jgi:hypothetical protein